MTTLNKITLIIADDHPLVRSGVYKELENVEQFEVIGETGDGNEALALINKLNPNVAVLDFQMPGLNGIEIVEKLKEIGSSTKVILLTMHDEKQIFFKALEVGVNAYVLKDDAVLDIVEAVKNVVDGKEFISKNLTGLMLEKIKKADKVSKKEILISELTSLEKNILSLVAELNTNDEISNKLFISKRTVENYKVNIAKKLQLNGARELLKYSIENKNYLEQAF